MSEIRLKIVAVPPFHKAWVIALCATTLLSASPAMAQTDAHYTAGVTAFSAGDYAKAVAEMSASLAAAPNVNAALYLGNAHLKLGQLDAAKTALQKALAIDPATPKRAAILELIKGIDSARKGTVKVTSSPVGATIYLQTVQPQNARGRTPAELSLPPGRHELVFVLDGYETTKQVVQVKPKGKAEINVDLSAKGCPIEITAEPASTKAAIDGAEPGAVPVRSQVGLGAHKVTLTAEGYESKTIDVTCDGNKPLTVAAKLDAAMGRVKVAGATGGAAAGVLVTIDGRALTPKELSEGVTLPVGTHEVVFSRNGKVETKKTIVIAAAQEVAVEPPTAEPPPPAQPPPPPPPPPRPRQAFPAPGLYVGVAGGANITTVEWNLGTDTKGAHPKSSAMGGLRVGVQLLPRLAAEAEAHWIGLPNRLDDGLGHGLALDANGVFHILPGRWTPIVEAGAGTYQVLSSALRADSDLRLHAGLGMRGRISDAMSLRLDVRDVITDGFDKSIGNNVEVLVGIDAYLWKWER